MTQLEALYARLNHRVDYALNVVSHPVYGKAETLRLIVDFPYVRLEAKDAEGNVVYRPRITRVNCTRNARNRQEMAERLNKLHGQLDHWLSQILMQRGVAATEENYHF